jgi:hypothetical protein
LVIGKWTERHAETAASDSRLRRFIFATERDEMELPHEEEPRETPLDDPRQKTDWPTHKQTDEPWKGNPEKDQLDPNRPDIDLEKWQQSNTH